MSPERDENEVTRLLEAIVDGDAKASEDLLPLVYEELRVLARARMANEPSDHTLEPTALVHEAYIRLLGPKADDGVGSRWDSRGHFFGAAAIAMRRILIERARRQQQLKRGGGRRREDLEDGVAVFQDDPTRLIALDEALSKLEEHDPRKAQIVTLRYFGGLSIKETAEAAGVSEATVSNDWAYAKAWLFREMRKGDSGLGRSGGDAADEGDDE